MHELMLRREGPRWQRVALALIYGLAAVLYGWAIWSAGYGDPFYAAAVRSMSEGWKNFLFGSFDPLGVITVDKPPMALWVQVAFVKVLGFHPWAILLPQVIEGVAAVFLLHRTVRRWAGENVALVAALALATTPIVVAVARDNILDTLMMLWLVAAAYALVRAVEAGSGRWLVLSALFVGFGFTTKMMEAWVVVPVLALAFLFGAALPLGRRLLLLLGSGAVLLVSSFWWVAVVDLWPGPKPFIGSSPNGTALALAVGYNGLERIFGFKPVGGQSAASSQANMLVGFLEGGIPGPQRLFNSQVGPQISWLLPLAFLTLIVVGVAAVRALRARRWAPPVERAGWILFGGWALTGWVVLSVALGAFHPYYTEAMAPAVAAVAGAGLDRLWRSYRSSTGRGWVLLPLAVAVTAVWAFVLVWRDPAWNGWLGPVALALGLASVGLLLAPRLSRVRFEPLARPAALLVLATLVAGPTTWAVATGFGPSHALFGPHNPSAGPFVMPPVVAYVPAKIRPALEGALVGLQPGGQFDILSGRLTPAEQRLLDYTESHAGGAPIALAVEGGAIFSSSYLINARRDDVIGMGGYLGSDPAPTVDQLASWKASGRLRFVLAGAPTTSRNSFDLAALVGGPVAAARERWVRGHCRVVPASAYGGWQASRGAIDLLAGEALYDCGR